MSFKRVTTPQTILHDESLTASLIGIGFRLGGEPPTEAPNIEDVLFSAALEGISKPDYRLLSLLVDWISIHWEMVNVDRLNHLVGQINERRFKAFWAAIAQWQGVDTRWKKLTRHAPSERVDLLEFGTEFLCLRHGEDKRFQDTWLRVPHLTLRSRPEDILSITELAARHRGYYFRLVIGPSYRADMWAFLEQYPTAGAAEIARSAYGSFSSAWGVKKDFERVRGIVKKYA